MRISYNWLKEYVNIKLSPEKLAHVLTMAGLAVESVEKTADDAVLEIEITSNRPDWLSYIGVAREVAAIVGGHLKIPSCVVRRASCAKDLRNTQYAIRNTISVKVSDKRLCPRYTARIIRNVKVGESPSWLKAKIEAMGLRPVNNVVDITNFCLYETGEPMHAFDLDRLEGGIIVRRAGPGEKITAIDGVARALDDTMLVIADTKKAVAIAGVMGGIDTEVGASTKNILLEAAFFDPISIRRTARRLAVSTESSYRFERRVDAGNIVRASDRAAALIKELAGGEIGEFIDIGSKKESGRGPVALRYSRCGKIIGLDIPPAKIKKILASLGLKVVGSSKGGLKLAIPGFRYDLKDEIDVIEEVARVYGYDNVPATIPQISGVSARMPSGMVIDSRIRGYLTGLGMDEIITYSLLGKKALVSAAISCDDAVEIANPLTAEQEIMRPSLMVGMLNSVLWNINRKTRDLALFELGNIYLKEGGSFSERKHLSAAMTGEISDWLGGTRQRSFYDLKGALEGLLSELGVADVSFKEARLPEVGTKAVGQARHDGFSRLACASIEIKGSVVGVIGEISKKTAADFDIKEKIYYCELCIGMVSKYAALEKRFSAIPRYPSVYRDISVVVPKEVTNAQLESSARESGRPILKDVFLIDRYRGKQIPDGKTSLTYRLEYQDPKKTLTEKEISDVHGAILRSLEEKLGAQLRY